MTDADRSGWRAAARTTRWSVRHARVHLRWHTVGRWHRIRVRRSDRATVVHHGIQRSGTNYLCVLLGQAGYEVLNRIDPPRGHPTHKHHRWQAEKSSIVMDRRFAHDHQVDTLADVETLCGYRPDLHHVVIFKSPGVWLDSIRRWGHAVGWFTDEADFFGRGLAVRYLREWDAYYQAWDRLAASAPGRVHLVMYEELVRDPVSWLTRLGAVTGNRPGFTPVGAGRIERVPHSPNFVANGAAGPEPRGTDLVELGFDWRRGAALLP